MVLSSQPAFHAPSVDSGETLVPEGDSALSFYLPTIGRDESLPSNLPLPIDCIGNAGNALTLSPCPKCWS